jgi:hypothetical protein
MSAITPLVLVLLLFWTAFGFAFLTEGARWRFPPYIVLWQLVTPAWPFWLDALLLLASFTLAEMALRALWLSRHKAPAADLP